MSGLKDVTFDWYGFNPNPRNASERSKRPVLFDNTVDKSNRVFFQSGPGTKRINARHLEFGDKDDLSKNKDFSPTVISANGASGVTFYDCTLSHVANAVNVDTSATDVLVQGITQTEDDSLRSNLLYFQGTRAVVQGNMIRNSAHEHCVRVMGSGTSFVSVAQNDFTNPGGNAGGKETVSFRFGSHCYIWNNKLKLGRIQVGDDAPTGAAVWAVIDSNEQQSNELGRSVLDIRARGSNVLARNNVFRVTTNSANTAITIVGSSLSSNIIVANNTLYNNLSNSQYGFLTLGKAGISGLRVLNNLNVVTHDTAAAGSQKWSGYNILMTETSPQPNTATIADFAEVRGNVWAPRAGDASMAVHRRFVAPNTSQTYKSDQLGSGNTAQSSANTMLDPSTYRPASGSEAVKQGRGTTSVRFDRNGKPRPTSSSAITTAGAIQIDPPSSLVGAAPRPADGPAVEGSNPLAGDPVDGATGAPTGLTATAVTWNQIDLAWMDNSSDEAEFIIERASDAAFTQNVATFSAPANTTTYSDWELSPTTAYHYRVYATTYDLNSDYSNAATASTPAVPPPADPTGLTATAVAWNQVSLSWADNSSDETDFIIERASDAAFTQNVTRSSVYSDTTTYTDEVLNPTTTYYYRVFATTYSLDSGFSNTAVATTPAVPPPANPTGLTATATSGTEISLAWVDHSTDESGFVVERATDSTFADGFVIGTTYIDETAYADYGLDANTTYYYRVRATKEVIDSGNSNAASATTAPLPPPDAPPDLTAVAASATQVDLNWNDPTYGEADFEVERATDAAFTQNVELYRFFSGTTSFSDDYFEPGAATYFYRVRAVRAGVPSATDSNTAGTTAGQGAEGFRQGTDGTVSIEAERYTNKADRNGDAWLAHAGAGGHSGTGAMQAGPGTGTTAYPGDGPQLDYSIRFAQAGTHYVWVRGLGTGGADGSVYVGLNGTVASADNSADGLPQSGLGWSNTEGAVRLTIDVPDAGFHTLNLFVRQGGTVVDKLVVTPDANYTPVAAGPAETAENRFTEDGAGFTTIEAETYSGTVSRNGSTWSADAGTAGYSGSGAVRAGPATGAVLAAGNGAQVDYAIDFKTAGTHYVWVRGVGTGGADGSVYVQLNNAASTATGDLARSGYRWVGADRGAVRIAVEVPSVGLHTLSLFVRQPGTVVDKLVVVTDPEFAPDGFGPDATA